MSSLVDLAQKYENAQKELDAAKEALANALLSNGMASLLQKQGKRGEVVELVVPSAGTRKAPRKAGRRSAKKLSASGETNSVVAGIKQGKFTRATLLPWLMKQEKTTENGAVKLVREAVASKLIRTAGRAGYKLL